MIDGTQKTSKLQIRCTYCMDKLEDLLGYTERHGFSDASEITYGCCIYFKFIKKSVICNC